MSKLVKILAAAAISAASAVATPASAETVTFENGVRSVYCTGSETSSIDAQAIFEDVSARYQAFNEEDMGQLRAQICLYSDEWMSQLSDEDRAEAYHQQSFTAYNLLNQEVIEYCKEWTGAACVYAFPIESTLSRLNEQYNNGTIDHKFVDLISLAFRRAEAALELREPGTRGYERTESQLRGTTQIYNRIMMAGQ